jgi:hypothetical protein
VIFQAAGLTFSPGASLSVWEGTQRQFSGERWPMKRLPTNLTVAPSLLLRETVFPQHTLSHQARPNPLLGDNCTVKTLTGLALKGTQP